MEPGRYLFIAATVTAALTGSVCSIVPSSGEPLDVAVDDTVLHELVDAGTDLVSGDLQGDGSEPGDVPPVDGRGAADGGGDASSTCGDVVTDDGEDCDDGQNGNPVDGCRDDCTFTCSTPTDDCEDVSGDCGVAVCEAGGLGQICGVLPADDPPLDGNPCTTAACDDGVPTFEILPDGAACDNNAGLDGDYCVSATCAEPICGDGISGPLEACDDQNSDPCDGCLEDCSSVDLTCGDGYTCGDEGCDDQDGDECDGCLSDCSLHENFCGDGFECFPEECDDGNEVNDDGCSADCTVDEAKPCPADMVLVPAAPEADIPVSFCMDRYEASRQDATAASMGLDTTIAKSQPGVLPWWENPFGPAQLQLFQSACQAAGKHLCEEHEWYHSCAGIQGNVYVFGDVFDKDICNCVDTWCDIWCQEHGIDPPLDDDGCGLALYNAYPDVEPSFHPVPTGYMTGCMNEFGAYDLGGNVWEVIPDDPETSPIGWDFQIRGGAYDSGSPSLRLQCTFEANWTALYAGFRCCRASD